MAACVGGAGLKRSLTDEERALWRRIQRSVRPRPGQTVLDEPEPAPGPAAAPPPPRNPAPAPPAKPVAPRKPAAPADRGGEKRVRRGRLDIAAKLDLHGCSQARAKRALGDFLQRQCEEGAGVVLVVTGRGMRMDAEGERRPGVLRMRLPEWLREPEMRPWVSGYAVAHAQHGGEGAYYVFLRRSRS